MSELKFIADLHTHTLASSHAYSTITENALWASQHGIKYLAMTDHGIRMEDAPHTWHFENLGTLPDELHGVRILRGIEANIVDFDGNIDIFKNYIYGTLEWINVSFHPQVIMPSTVSDHTKAYLGVLKNPHVDVIAHSEDKNYVYDYDEVAKACADSGKLIEVNVCRLERKSGADERYTRILEACEKYGTRIVVGSDAHFYTKIGEFGPAVQLIEKLGFPSELILNADETKFNEYLKTRK